jgi:hypothetical protein
VRADIGHHRDETFSVVYINWRRALLRIYYDSNGRIEDLSLDENIDLPGRL